MIFRYIILIQLFLCSFCLGKERLSLSICAIFKNEAPFLKEWIEFHKLQGIEHFFLYNNGSTDSYRKVLQPYLIEKVVTLVDWNYSYAPQMRKTNDVVPWIEVQRGAYNNCLYRFGRATKWLAFIDIDEFLFCTDGQKPLQFLENFEKFGGVRVSTLNFGTSHIKKMPKNKLQIECFTRCSQKNYKRSYIYKSIVRPEAVETCASAHSFLMKKGYSYQRRRKEKLFTDPASSRNYRTSVSVLSGLRINHYFTRSEKNYWKKKIQSRLRRRSYETVQKYLNISEELNKSSDTAILQFVDQLKANMGL